MDCEEIGIVREKKTMHRSIKGDSIHLRDINRSFHMISMESVQKYFKFDSLINRKPVKIFEVESCDSLPHSILLYKLQSFEIF